MGWRWHDDDVSGGRGIGDIPDLANPSPRLGGGGGEEGAQCATRRVVRSSCRTEEVEPGRFVRKCEKTEQLLRDCIGRTRSLRSLRLIECKFHSKDGLAEIAQGFPLLEGSIFELESTIHCC